MPSASSSGLRGPGSTFGRFSIEHEIGSGGMGTVYRAHDPVLHRSVAIKVLHDASRDARARLIGEARLASALNHPNVCTIHDVGDVDGTPYITMELIEGEALRSWLARGVPVVDRAVNMAGQIANALAHAHERQVVHGDVNSQNVMVLPDDSVKLVDFGLARTLAPVSMDSITRSALGGPAGIAGTLPYMSPEVLRGAPPTPASDVWALGVLLHEMVTGARPFNGATAFDLASAILNDTAVPVPSSIPPAIATTIARCLDKNPANRFRSAGDVATALQVRTGPARDASLDPVPTGRRRTTRLLVLAALTIALSSAALLIWRWTRSGGAAARPAVTSLIVLPFDSQSPESNETYFADGMTDALITDLSQIPSLKVISRTSSVQYRALRKTSQDLARELGVQAIVDGAVLHAGGRVRISVRLVDAATDRNLWGDNYTRQVGDVLALQADVARAVAGEIRRSFSPADEARLAAPVSLNPQAVEAYLKGRYQWNRRTPAALQAAADEFRKAIALEPNYALAHAGLAQATVLLPVFSLGTMSPLQAYPEARREAEAALKLDDRLAEAHAALAYERLYSLDWAAAEASFRRAIEVNPNYATAHFWYAATLASVERFDESIAEARLAQTLDPVSPIIVSGTAWMHHLARRFDQEVEAAKSALTLDPNFMIARYRLAEGLLHQQQFDAAVVEFEKALALSDGSPDLVAALAYAHARAGRSREARDGLRRLLTMNADSRRYISPLAIALVYTGLGDRDNAFTWIERAIEINAWGAAFLRVEADFDLLRSDPRMKTILARIGPAPTRGQ